MSKQNRCATGIVRLIIAVIVPAVFLFGCSRSNEGKRGDQGRPIPVHTVGLERGDLPYELSLTGEIVAPERAEIATTIGGRINRITVRLGDRIKRGALLVRLDTTILAAQYAEAKAKRAAAKAAVQRAQVEYDNAASDLERIEVLAKKGFVTKQELDAARALAAGSRASLASAEAQHDQAKAGVGTLAAQLAEASITAPFDGLVEARYLDPGNVVGAGTPILALTRTSPATLHFSIPERHIGAVGEATRSGAPVVELMLDAFPGETFTGRIVRISPVLEAGSRARPVEAEFANDDHRLLPGMYGRLRVQLGVAENVLLLPLDALVKTSSGETLNGSGRVYVVRDDVAELVEVKIGHRRGDFGEVLSGLADSDRVVVAGQHLLRDGAKVQNSEPADDAATENTAGEGGEKKQ